MRKIISFFFLTSFFVTVYAVEIPWDKNYQDLLMEKVSHELVRFSNYPATKYPNANYQQILNKHPNGKVLLFGYGSLINATSAARSVSPEAIQSMEPVVAFGLKRIFNYEANSKILTNYRANKNLPDNERAMLNVEATTTFQYMINGVVMEVDQKDLEGLISRETGYDLTPVLVANWNDVISENPNVEIKVAYTFYVPDELREGIDYTQTKYYPVRAYLNTVRTGSAAYGQEFLDFWNATTFLGDGTTRINKWNEETFSGILDTKAP